MSSVISETTVAKLAVRSGDQQFMHHVLSDGASVMVGSGSNCGVRLDDAAISSIHCVVRMDDGVLFLQDWCTNLGTHLNGKLVKEEVQVPHGSCIKIGRFEIHVDLGTGGSLDPAHVQAAGPLESVKDAEGAPSDREERASSPQAGVDDRRDELQSRPASSVAQIDRQTGSPAASILESIIEPAPEPTAQSVPDSESEPAPVSESVSDRIGSSLDSEPSVVSSRPAKPQPRRSPPKLILEGIDPEVIELLQAELECLQTELSERDRQLIELQDLVDNAETPELQADSSETESLVGRLEQLLEELESGDHRTRVLEELLRNEQEVTRAQQEEKTQIEAWLNDIEVRISAREQEWKAEREALLRRVEQIRSERDDADRRIEASENSPHDDALQKTIVTELRGKVDELHDALESSERRREVTQAKLSELESKSPEEARQEFVEEALRADRLKLAQEQAALSRDRAKFANRIAELEGEAKRDQRSEADERFRAFRQTLKELHSEDQVSSPGVRKATLGTRITDLWRKLDGPTDTD